MEHADTTILNAAVSAVLPVPALAGPLAEDLNAILSAELPPSPSQDVGCQGIPTPCPDPLGLLTSWFRVQVGELVASGQVDPFALIGEFIESLRTPSELAIKPWACWPW